MSVSLVELMPYLLEWLEVVEEPQTRKPFTRQPGGLAHICSGSVSQPLFCRAAQLPARPQAAPTRAANTAKTQSQQRSSSSPSPPNPITQRQRQPPGGLGWVPEPPWCRESRSCGRAACSRENCALCVDEICTVISSAVRVCRPRVGARRTGPASTAD